MHKSKLTLSFTCQENWDDMAKRSNGRFCDRCQHKVHDLSSMTPDQYNTFSQQHAGQDICVRYAHNKAGQVTFATPSKPPTPPWKNQPIVNWLSQQHTHLKTLSIASTTALSLAACSVPPQPPTPHLTTQERTEAQVHFDKLNERDTEKPTDKKPLKNLPGKIKNITSEMTDTIDVRGPRGNIVLGRMTGSTDEEFILKATAIPSLK